MRLAEFGPQNALVFGGFIGNPITAHVTHTDNKSKSKLA